MKKILMIVGFLSTIGLLSAAESKSADTKTVSSAVAKAAETYNKCASCHGFDGEKKALGKSKRLDELTKDQIKDSLLNYKKGVLNKNGMGALMKTQTSEMSEKDMENMAEYIVDLKKRK